MRMKAVLLAVAVLAASPLTAHHSFAAEFDASKPVTLQGTVTKVDWTNPHVFLFVDVPDKRGKTANWRVESSAPNGLIREGWVKESLKAGDRVTIEAYMAKDEEHFAKSRAVILPGGRRVVTGATE
jgi:hypothetical protein